MPMVMMHVDDYAIKTGKHYVYADGGFCARGVTPESAFMNFISRMSSFSDYMRKRRKRLRESQAN